MSSCGFQFLPLKSKATITTMKGVAMQNVDSLRNGTSINREMSIEKRRPGRPALPPEEKARREAERKIKNRVLLDARRRAGIILQERHADEFKALLTEQLNRTQWSFVNRMNSLFGGKGVKVFPPKPFQHSFSC